MKKIKPIYKARLIISEGETDAATKTDIKQDDTKESLKEKESRRHRNTSKKQNYRKAA